MINASVIVTSYNNSHNLKNCLEGLLTQNHDQKEVNLEIIVVDSGSIDNSIEILDNYKGKIKIILNPTKFPRLSPAQARNIGVKNSRGDILLFTDSDCVPPRNWVKEIIVSFQKYQIDCVIGTREPDIGEGLGTFVRRYDFILYSNKFIISEPLIINQKNLQKGQPFILLAGNNFGMKRELWNKIGGMKTIFKNPTGEDIMMEIEIIKHGANILFNPYIKVHHIHPVSLTKLFRKAFQHGESTCLLEKYSNNFINWRHFAERGHIFHLKWACFNLFLFIMALSILILLGASFLIIIAVFSTFFLIIFFSKLILLKNNLFTILNNKGGEYKKLYKISLVQLFYFNIIHFLTKILGLIGFLYSYIKYAVPKKIIE